MGVAAADLELFHDLVSGHRTGRCHQQSMDLRHGSIDPPLTPQGTPLADKFVPRLFKFFSLAAHIFSIY
jgi:hypothetical protein